MSVLQRGRGQQGVGVAAGGGLLLQLVAGRVDAAVAAGAVGAAGEAGVAGVAGVTGAVAGGRGGRGERVASAGLRWQPETAAVRPTRRQALRPREAAVVVVPAPRRAAVVVPLQYWEATAAEAAR